MLVLLFLVVVIVIYIFEKKKDIEFLLAAVLFTCGSDTVQNKIVCGIRFLPFVSRKETTF